MTWAWSPYTYPESSFSKFVVQRLEGFNKIYVFRDFETSEYLGDCFDKTLHFFSQKWRKLLAEQNLKSFVPALCQPANKCLFVCIDCMQ